MAHFNHGNKITPGIVSGFAIVLATSDTCHEAIKKVVLDRLIFVIFPFMMADDRISANKISKYDDACLLYEDSDDFSQQLLLVTLAYYCHRNRIFNILN